jgi:hypothetical protein
MSTDISVPVACSNCFVDFGLRSDAWKIGRDNSDGCPNCGATDSKKLPIEGLGALAHRFFVWGSILRFRYGAAPIIQFNDQQETSIELASSLVSDVKLFEKILGIGFFHYGPRSWMFGEIEPLKALQIKRSRPKIINRILKEYPVKLLDINERFFRVRVNPTFVNDSGEYDSPPVAFCGKGRLDSVGNPVMYGSPDLEVCLHECRVSVADNIFVASLKPAVPLRLLDLSHILHDDSSEFESLDLAVHMLFLAGKHSYRLSRGIADAARAAGFDGIIYPSYFSLIRLGFMPLETTYGISHRVIPELQPYEQAKIVPNFAIFGRPIVDGKVEVECINRLILSRVAYDFHFGPTGA